MEVILLLLYKQLSEQIRWNFACLLHVKDKIIHNQSSNELEARTALEGLVISNLFSSLPLTPMKSKAILIS